LLQDAFQSKNDDLDGQPNDDLGVIEELEIAEEDNN